MYSCIGVVVVVVKVGFGWLFCGVNEVWLFCWFCLCCVGVFFMVIFLFVE